YKSGAGDGQTKWFASKFAQPDASQESQDKEGEMLHLVRGLAHLRARHPAMANGELGDIPSDARDWLVFEKFAGGARDLVLMNQTATAQDYRFHQGWYPQYLKAQLIFWSDGARKRWRETTDDKQFTT